MNKCKIQYGRDIRRVATPSDDLAALHALVQRTFRIRATSVSYVDVDGDEVRVATDDDLREAFEGSRSSGSVVKFVVSGIESDPADDDDEAIYDDDDDDDVQEETDPVKIAARALSDRNNVVALQGLVGSDVVADAISAVARAFADAGPAAALASALGEAPMLKAVYDEFMERNPEINEAVGAIASKAAEAAFENCTTSLFCPGVATAREAPVHVGVRCDACDSDPVLRAASERAGTRVERWIVGDRYKSVSVHDFDLCASCEAPGSFDGSHGPFLKLRDPNQGRGCRRGGGGQPYHRGGHPWGRGGGCGRSRRRGKEQHRRRRDDDGEEGRSSSFRGRGCRGSRRGDAFKNTLFEGAGDLLNMFSDVASKNESFKEAADVATAIAESLKTMASSTSSAATDEKVVDGEPVADVPVPSDVVTPRPTPTTVDEPSEQEQRRASGSGVDEHWEKVDDETPLLDPMTKWEAELGILESIGYADDVATAIRILEEEKGVLERVVARISSLRA